MITVGLTGGIGSGKTTVANMFKDLGIPVYIADTEAKKLMVASAEVKEAIIRLFGEEAYKEDVLNREWIASRVFKDKELLQKLNGIVHPAVHKHFESWKKQQKAPYVVKEAAILFENGGYLLCDKMITVVAPLEERIKRVIKRDHTKREDVLARIEHQWDDERKIALSDYVVHNTTLETTVKEVGDIHSELIQL